GVIRPGDVDVTAGIHRNGRPDRVPRIVGNVQWRGEGRASIRGPAEENLRVAQRGVRPDDVDRAARIYSHTRTGGGTGVPGDILWIRERDAIGRVAEVNKVRAAVRAGLGPGNINVAARIHGDPWAAGRALRVLGNAPALSRTCFPHLTSG